MSYTPTISGLSSQIYKIASISSVDAATAATTTMTWNGGFTAGNTYPLFRVVTYKNGTIGSAVVSVALGTDSIDGGSLLSGLATGRYNYRPVDANIVLGTTGDYNVTIVTPNLTPATINVEIWGVLK